MTNDELIKEVLDRAMKSDLFCLRVIKACHDFTKKLNEESK